MRTYKTTLAVFFLACFVGVFSMPWEVVVQVFDSIYLNWDPTMFGSTATVHS